MKTNQMNNETEIKNNEARAIAIAQIQLVMDAEKARREAAAKAHLESEKAKW